MILSGTYFLIAVFNFQTFLLSINDHEEEADVSESSIIAKRFEFEPSTIEVNQGETIRLTVKSIDVKHGFGLREYGINEVLPPNKEVKIEFVADKVGEFTYYCSVPCGFGHGSMRGKLIVR